MKRLIINADDLGADLYRNGGIFEGIRAEIVTSVSILANGPAFDDALRRIRPFLRSFISCGVHLNLSEGKPLTPHLRLLTDADGFFLGKVRSHVLFGCRGESGLKKEIDREMDAQIEVLLNAGIPICHLDGHQHIHVFPAVIESTVRVIEKYKIPWVRIPEELPGEFPNDGPIAAEARHFSQRATEARSRLETSNVFVTDHFRGLYLKGNFTSTLLRNLLVNLPDGLTELMVHPGWTPPGNQGDGPFSSFSSGDRQTELSVLKNQGFRDALRAFEISLARFPEVSA